MPVNANDKDATRKLSNTDDEHARWKWSTLNDSEVVWRLLRPKHRNIFVIHPIQIFNKIVPLVFHTDWSWLQPWETAIGSQWQIEGPGGIRTERERLGSLTESVS